MTEIFQISHLVHLVPIGGGKLCPGVGQEVLEVDVGQIRRRSGPSGVERVPAAEKSCTARGLSQSISSSQQSSELPLCEAHHGDVVLQQRHGLVELATDNVE